MDIYYQILGYINKYLDISMNTEERSIRGPQSKEGFKALKIISVIPPSIEKTSNLTSHKKRKTHFQSLVSFPIPKLNGENRHESSEYEIEPYPDPNPDSEPETEPETEPHPHPEPEPNPVPVPEPEQRPTKAELDLRLREIMKMMKM